MTKQQNTNFLTKKNYFLTKTVIKRLKSLKTCLKITNRQTAQKLKVGQNSQKLIKKK